MEMTLKIQFKLEKNDNKVMFSVFTIFVFPITYFKFP